MEMKIGVGKHTESMLGRGNRTEQLGDSVAEEQRAHILESDQLQTLILKWNPNVLFFS